MRLLMILILGLLVAAPAQARPWDDSPRSSKAGVQSKSLNRSERGQERNRSTAFDLQWSNLNSGVCDDLMGATRGLRLMCMAFCELQDCQPDMALEDPFESCSLGSQWLFSRYEARRQAGDPEMPCIKQPPAVAACPCWSVDDLSAIRTNALGTGQSASCTEDMTAGPFVNVDSWQISTPEYFGYMASSEGSPNGTTCNLVDKVCAGGTCEGKSEFLEVTMDQLAACELDVAALSADVCP